MKGEDREYAIPSLMGKAVAGELSFGLEELEEKKIDVDQLPFEKVKVHSS